MGTDYRTVFGEMSRSNEMATVHRIGGIRRGGVRLAQYESSMTVMICLDNRQIEVVVGID